MNGIYTSELSNDELKYFIPEFWTTNLVMTANVRELRHIVRLRTNPAALREFQNLARYFVEVLPDEFKYLLEDCVWKEQEQCK
ncbi:MAG: FAD-dependent thymidylate synthase [Synergistaceae bacterium]|nr:FAD-dependent thymidylate synthase [Synergistaceae bacterium]